MSPSDPVEVDQPPAEILAIAVALAVLWPDARLETAGLERPDGPPAWRWGRPGTYRWS